MTILESTGKSYQVDEQGFLSKPEQWDAGFAREIAPELGIIGGLTDDHWCVITFIRDQYMKTGQCPMVYEIGRNCGIRLAQMKILFPTGYLRGACKLAGITYRLEEVHTGWLPAKRLTAVKTPLFERIYHVNYRGFLIDPADWDEEYAIYKAKELGMVELTQKHWELIGYLREQFTKTAEIPTDYETCEANHLELEDLEKLFPTGYHRGAVKISGLMAN